MESFSTHVLFLNIWDLYFCILQQWLSSSSSSSGDNHKFSYIYIFYLISLLKISSIVVLKLNHASEFLEALHKTHISGLHCQELDSAGLGWGWRTFLSNKISGDVAAGLGLYFIAPHSLVVWWMRTCLPAQRMWVRSLVWKIPHAAGRKSQRAQALDSTPSRPSSHNQGGPGQQLLTLVCPEPTLRERSPWQWEAGAPRWKNTAPITAARESLRVAMKTQCNHSRWEIAF